MANSLHLGAPTWIAAWVCSAALTAQFQFAYDARHTLPVAAAGLDVATLADFDGDHRPDLCGMTITAGTPAQLVLMRNDGHGNFPNLEPISLTATVSSLPSAIVAADFDGDGDLDLALGFRLLLGQFGQTRLLLNDGSGHFTESTSLPNDNYQGSSAVAAFDCDGDHDIDLFLSGASTVPGGTTPDRLLLNNGSGGFTLSTLPLPQDSVVSTSPVAADVDGDGDVDLCFLRATTTNPLAGGATLYLNDGAGGFSDATATNLPTDFGIGGQSLILFDADGDLDLDLAVAATTDGASSIDRLVLNDGTGHFPAMPIHYFPLPARGGTTRLLPLDIDGDGDLDLYVARVDEQTPSAHTAAPDALWVNDGTGHFTGATSSYLPGMSTAAYDAMVDDTDGDGDLDVIVFEHVREQYLRNESGTFVDDSCHRLPAEQIEAEHFELADVDGDGQLDMLVTRAGDSTLTVARNDGDGRFHFLSRTPVASTNFITFDADGDHFADVLELVDGQDRLLRGDGRGGFTDVTSTSLPIESDDTLAAVSFDEDGDGDLDVLRTDDNPWSLMPNRWLWRNDGAGHFTLVTTFTFPWVESVPVLAIDVEGDGDMDLLGLPSRKAAGVEPKLFLKVGGVFVNAGTARFPNVNEWVTSFAVGDVDGDHDLDIVLGSDTYVGQNTGQNHLFLNQGGATFTDNTTGHLIRRKTLTSAVALCDIDGDGDLDLVETTRHDNSSSICLNNGHGVFTTDVTTRMESPLGVYGALRVADLDGDGDPDLISDGPVVRMNRQHQIEAPFEGRLGGQFIVRAHVEPGYGATQADVWLWYALARLQMPIVAPPWGSLHLDPTTLIYERHLTTTRGVLDHVLVVPNAPALLGVTLQIQAAHVQLIGPRFGNVLTERIGR